MRYSTVFKFIAFVLCAATLLGMVSTAAGIFFLTELGGKSVNQFYEDQVYNRAIGYANIAGEIYLSETLGDMPRQLMDTQYGNDWESWYFDWTKVGFTLRDSDGNPVQEREIYSGQKAKYSFEDLPVVGQYRKRIATMTSGEFYASSADAQAGDARVMVMPAQEHTVIGAVYVDYTDGHQEVWDNDGTQLGVLSYTGGNDITFISNIGEFPVGDGWYPNHVLMLDMGGNVVYEVTGGTNVLLGTGYEDGVCKIYLPAGTVTTAAPAGNTVVNGTFTAYDAIPAYGMTVASMNVAYANRQGETVGSEGMSSPDLIGTIFHNAEGNAKFRSKDAMVLDIPEDCHLTQILFMDAQGSLIYEANCPDGVGTIAYEENGCLVFRAAGPEKVQTEQEIPETTEAAVTEPEKLLQGKTGITLSDTEIFSMPSRNGQVVGHLKPGQEVLVLAQESFASGEESREWAMLEEGWVLLEALKVTHEEKSVFISVEESTAATETAVIVPETTAATQPAPTTEATEATAAATRTIPEPTVAATVATPEETYPQSEIAHGFYYDSEQKQEMVAQYVTESIPAGYTMDIHLATGALRNELGWTLLRLAELFDHILLEALGICMAVFALCVVHLCCSAGRTRRTNEVRAGGLNRIPLDLYVVGAGFAVTGLVAGAFYGSQYFARNDEQLAIIFCGACAYLTCLILVAFFFAFVAQIKTPGGYWWRNTICGRGLRLMIIGGKKLFFFGRKTWGFGKGSFLPGFTRTCSALWLFAKRAALWMWDTAKRLLIWGGSIMGKSLNWSAGKLARFFGMLPITWQFLTTGFSLVVLLYAMMRTYKVGYILLGFGIFFATILYAASAFAILLENAKKMSKGDLDTKVDDRMLIGGFREFAERLNDLADVAVVAAQKQLKSERMKTELITNVSHDIKTPLTSIINYVDLLRKPHTEEQHHQYLDVLDRQSQRLKKLVDDLMEMSKASTGNLTVEITRVDAAEAVNQALGEFADKLERAQLTPVFRQPEKSVEMMADGRLVWRVMSNLLGNAVKYALPGTRIYLDLMEMDGRVIISMKNISREELNVHADELMERFVRGDASRNTEGSGLGLNIAQSLMELQKGQLQVLVDGDLFKVTMIFPAA